MVEWGKRENPLVEAVRAISIFGEGEAGGRQRTPEEIELDAMRGPVVAQNWKDDPRLSPAAKDRADRYRMVKYGPADDDVLPAWVFAGDDVAEYNSAGSYEALVGGWTDGFGKKSFAVPS
jgi:hypothetical protein